MQAQRAGAAEQSRAHEKPATETPATPLSVKMNVVIVIPICHRNSSRYSFSDAPRAERGASTSRRRAADRLSCFAPAP